MKTVARVLVTLLALAVPAAAGTLTGVVHNGTKDAVVPRQEVTLIALQGGMQPVQTVQTDAQGRYSFDRPEIGGGPMLVQVPYRGVNYNHSIRPGMATADIEIYEATASAASLALVNHAIIVRPDGETLVVGEEFAIHNLSKPPATFFSDKGTFDFSIPAGATLREVSAAGPAGMPLTQSTTEKGKDHYSLAFALKPGENTIRVSYNFPYPGNQAKFEVVAPLAAQRVVLAGPVGVEVSSDGFAPAGNEQGFAFFSRDSIAANTPVSVTVSGAAAPSGPAAGGDARDAGAANRASESANITPIAPRVAGVQWILIAGFIMLFALGVFYLWRQPRTAPAAAVSAELLPPRDFGSHDANAQRKRGQVPSRAAEQHAAPLPSPAAAAVHPAAAPLAAPVSVEDVHRDVRLSLDELRDTLFRLELRHQAGTIPDDEYARERARLEAVLRSLVRG